MVKNYFPLLFFLIILAALFQDDFSFTLLYLFFGAYAFSTWWSRRSLKGIRFNRSFITRAFIGEDVHIKLEIKNNGWLPIPWIRIHESLPVELSGPDSFQYVTNIGSRTHKVYNYQVKARQRGYYPVGPISFWTSDILGLSTSDLRVEGASEYLIVYPKIIHLTKVAFPSKSPLGTMRHHQPIFEDPTRVIGKRDYLPGDSLRRIDWKSTAMTGRMQVKLFEPSIALDTVILLNLNAEDYYQRTRIADTELAVVIAASIANWIVGKQQSVGIMVNGIDPLGKDENPEFIPSRTGRNNLMRVLDVLARIKVGKCPDFTEKLRYQRSSLSWGTTLTIITGSANEELIDELFQAKRSGLNVSLILAGTVPASREIVHRAGFFGIPSVNIPRERDMDIWRG